jgi:hypothetical protein
MQISKYLVQCESDGTRILQANVDLNYLTKLVEEHHLIVVGCNFMDEILVFVQLQGF